MQGHAGIQKKYNASSTDLKKIALHVSYHVLRKPENKEHGKKQTGAPDTSASTNKYRQERLGKKRK